MPHKHASGTNVVPYGPGDTYASCGMVGSTSGSSLVTVTVSTTVITTSTRPHMRQTRCGRGAQDDNVTKLDQMDSPTMPSELVKRSFVTSKVAKSFTKFCRSFVKVSSSERKIIFGPPALASNFFSHGVV